MNANSIIPRNLQKMMEITKKMQGGRDNLINGVAELAKMNSNVTPKVVYYAEYRPQPKKTRWNQVYLQNSDSAATIDIKTPFRYMPPPPENLEELIQRLAVRNATLQKRSKLYKRIFPKQGKKSKDKKGLIIGNFIFAIEGFYCEEIKSYIPPGGWVNLDTLQHGKDSIEFYATFRGYSYRKAIAILAKYLDIDLSSTKYSHNKKNWWTQVKDPLVTPKLHNYLDYGCQLLSSYEYRNDVGEIIACVYNILLPNGKTVQYFKTLWRHNQSETTDWLDLDPEIPYMIYNEDLIAYNSGALVVFAEDEKQAHELQTQNDPNEKVFSACPRGLQNLPYADIKLLNGRRISVILEKNSPEIQAMPEFIEKAKATGVSEILFTFDFGSSFVSSDEFMKEPEKYGCLPTKPNLSRSISPITQIGETLPGSEKQRKNLIQPIIKEGYIVWLYADSKIGKTWLALFIAYIASKGSSNFGSWTCTEPVGVMYIDIESLPDEFVNCCTMIMKGQSDKSDIIPFRIFSAKAQPEGEIDIMSEDCQRLIESELNGINMIIIDSLYLATDNQPSKIRPVLRWLSKLSQKGIAVIVVDHTNKEGELQGSISKERAANLSIKLEQHPDCEDQIVVSYPVARSLPQKDAKPFTLRKIYTKDSFKFELVEEHKIAEPDIPEKIKIFAKVMFLKTNKSLTYEEIAKATGISRSAVGKYVKDDIPALTGQDKKLYDKELSRLIAEDETRNGIPEDSEQ